MRLWTILAVFLGGWLGSQPAFAAKAEDLDKQAQKACLSGDYLKGVSILTDLYLETEDATYLYNQGRCYEQNVRYVEAAERFREYLRKAKRLSKRDREEAYQHIAECDVAIAKTRVAEAPPPPPPPPPPPEDPTPPPPAPKQDVVVLQEPPPPPPPPAPEARPWQRTAKWVAAGAAVAFLGVGVVEHVRYYGKNKDFNDDSSCPAGPGCQSLADSADTALIVALVGYGAAAVATGLAVTFFLTDKPSSATGERARLGITCAPAFAGVSCTGRF